MTESAPKNEVESPTRQYVFRDQNVNGSEWERLDELHGGFSAFMKGELTFAPINKPFKIIDIGAGSGAWVKEAANRYPQAEVIAADISPLPARSFPSNVKFQYCDVLDTLPFENNSFDIVHMRLVLYHLPKLQLASVVRRVSEILKPKGWFIIEDFGRHTGHSAWPAQDKVNSMFEEILQKKGLESRIGEHLGHLIQDTEAFDEINVKKVQLTLTADQALPGVYPGERALSNAIKSTFVKLAMTMHISEDMRSAGFTPDLQKTWLAERQDPDLKTFTDVWFTWSRKRQSR